MLFLCKFCGLFIALCLPVCIRNDQYCWSHTVPLLISKRVFMRKAWCFTSAEGSVRDLLLPKVLNKMLFCKVEGSSSLSARKACAGDLHVLQRVITKTDMLLFFFVHSTLQCSTLQTFQKDFHPGEVHFPPRTVWVQHLHRDGSVTPPTGPHLHNLSQHLYDNLDRNKDLLFI